jgi:hypothetical protein
MSKVKDLAKKSNAPDESKRERVRKLLRENPNRGDRATAREAGVSHNLVACVRQELFGNRTGRTIRGGYKLKASGASTRAADMESADMIALLCDALDNLQDVILSGHYEAAYNRVSRARTMLACICRVEGRTI